MSARVLTNPLAFTGQAPTNPDPYVTRFHGRYYCYATAEDGVRLSVSEDMVTWSYLGLVYSEPGRFSYWAPCVVYRDGVYYLYVSSRPQGEEDSHLQRMRVATSATPTGPFTFVRQMWDSFCIDADVVIDERGRAFMYYATNDFTGAALGRAGTCVVVDEMSDMTHLAGRPRPVITPSLPEEVFAANRFGDGRDWYTIEGSTYVTYRGRAYMTYSGNAYEREDYFVGVASAEADEPIETQRWTKQPDQHTYAPLLRRTSEVEGTGHNSIVVAPNLVDPWIVYHGRDAHVPLDPSREQRVMRADRLYLRGDRLCCDGPSAQAVPAPALPLVAWREPIEVGHGPRAQRVVAESAGPYVAELSVRLPRSDMGARAGLVIADTPAERWTVWLDAMTRTVEVERTRHGVSELVSRQRHTWLDLTVWQTLTVERRLDDAVVRLGSVELARCEHGLGMTRAGVSVLAQHTQVDIGHLALTEHVEWYAARAGSIGHLVEVAPEVRVGEEGLVLDGHELTLPLPWDCGRLALDLEMLDGAQAQLTIGDRTWSLAPDADGRCVVEQTWDRAGATAHLTLRGVRLSALSMTATHCLDAAPTTTISTQGEPS